MHSGFRAFRSFFPFSYTEVTRRFSQKTQLGFVKALNLSPFTLVVCRTKPSSLTRRVFSTLKTSFVSRMAAEIDNNVVVELKDDKIGQMADSNSDFELVFSTTANNIHPVSKYRSKSTGLEVVLAEINGPIINGYICLATKAEDDDGLPHTLEHLIFMGSEDYPYKGVLDNLANKCLASGTNAWTDVDHTCYTLTTAGSEGFCTLLPIYMDHIMHPILSDTAFVTEVYHINGEGNDSGVVYSEIQATENTGENLSYVEVVRALYPPTSGYHWITGGVLKNLRETCNNEKVKAFHNKFYNSKNACVVVCGMVKPEDLFKALEPCVQKLVKKGKVVDHWEHPWREEIEEMKVSSEKTIYFPADEEEEDEDPEAIVNIALSGPKCDEIELVHAIRLLLDYLTDSSVGPLQVAFVENDSPLASRVSYSEIENMRMGYTFEFESVPPKEVKNISPKLKAVLEKQMIDFDMNRMKDVIRNSYQEELSSMENTPHSSIAYSVIGYYLYGSSKEAQFKTRLNTGNIMKDLLEKDISFWTNLLRHRLLNKEWVKVYAIASQKEQKQLSKEEEMRIKGRVERVGKDGLNKFAHELESAIQENSVPVPSKFLEACSVPSTKSIRFHDITRHDNSKFAENLKCKLYVDDIKSNFIYVTLLMDTSTLTLEERKFLPLYVEALTESPISLEDGTTLSFEEVVAGLNRDLVSHSTAIGVDGGGRFKCGAYNHVVCLNLQIELEKCVVGFNWIHRLLWKTIWNPERIKVLATKMANDVNQMKRKGNRMATTLLKDIVYKMDSNVKTSSLIRQQAFLKDLAGSLNKKGAENMKVLEGISKKLTEPTNLTVYVATNVDKFENSLSGTGIDVNKLFTQTLHFDPAAVKCQRLANGPDTLWMKESSDLMSVPKQVVLGLGSEDSAFFTQAGCGITHFGNPELPVLLTAMQYFCQTEGPFFKAIRGSGFAYGFWMDARPNEGLIYFNLYRCTDAVGAYKVALGLITAHLDQKDIWSEEYLVSAKSSLIFEIIEGEKTPLALASSSLCSYYRDVPGDHPRKMINRIADVTLEELRDSTAKYLGALFMKPTNCALICPTDKVAEHVEGFAKLGKKLDVLPSLTNCFLSKWCPPGE